MLANPVYIGFESSGKLSEILTNGYKNINVMVAVIKLIAKMCV